MWDFLYFFRPEAGNKDENAGKIMKIPRFAGMCALNTLKKFLKAEHDYVLYGHPHPNAVLEWFSEKYWGKKEVKIVFDKKCSAVIGDEYIEYISSNYKYIIDKKYRGSVGAWHIDYRLMLYSANYCKHCRDKRREIWGIYWEIIERLSRDARKFVMNLPMVADQYDINIVPSYTGLISKYSHGWYINDEPACHDDLLKEFKKRYNAAKKIKFSANLQHFADVCVRYQA